MANGPNPPFTWDLFRKNLVYTIYEKYLTGLSIKEVSSYSYNIEFEKDYRQV